MARKVGKSSASPLVNALLRRASRERGRLPLPRRAIEDPDGQLDYLETTLSHPRWLVERWRSRYGFEAAEAWCRFNNSAAPLTLRANRLRTTREELAATLASAEVETGPCRFAPDGLVVRTGNPLLTGIASQGLFMVQDEASQLVGLLAGARPGDRVLDACAAPGGKTMVMAGSMGDRGLVIALDVRAKRVRLLAETIRAAGARSVRVVQATAAEPLPFAAVFDLVLIDAPCSGLGTVRRDPDIKWRRSPEEFGSLASLQARILESAAAVVRPDGRILYSTCSSEPEENDEVVERFLRAAPNFRRTPLAFPAAPELIDSAGCLRTLPFRDGLEAFFAASLARQP
jgi:16S rRNA (cytosine967-C5)-methyltransferase